MFLGSFSKGGFLRNFRAFLSMKTFDPNSIIQTINVVAIKTTIQNVQPIRKAFSSIMYKRTAVKPIRADDDDPKFRLILLEPNEVPTKLSAENKFNSAQKTLLQQINDTNLVDYNLTLDFKSFSAEEILSKLLPAEISPVRGYETIGHIAHLNLRDEHEPYKNLIGEVILSKNPSLRTVITKVGNIKTKFRTFEMEVIAGDNDTEATVKEAGCTFKLDFRKVYWNSRLGTEHTELATSFCNTDTICKPFFFVCKGF